MFRVIFANIRFTPLKRRFERNIDVIKYLIFDTFGYIFLLYFCMHLLMDLGTVKGRIWSRIWVDFSRNVGFVGVLILRKFLH